MRKCIPSRNDPLGDFMALFPFILILVGGPILVVYMIVESLFL